MMDARVFTPAGMEPDAKGVEQLASCLADERAVAVALMADHHLGYSMPIGGVVAYEDATSPSGVGFDILRTSRTSTGCARSAWSWPYKD